MTTKISKISSSIGRRRCTVASGEEVLGTECDSVTQYAAKMPWSVTGITDLCDVLGLEIRKRTGGLAANAQPSSRHQPPE